MSADRDREEQRLRDLLEQSRRGAFLSDEDDATDDELLAARPRKTKPRHRIKDEE